METAAQEFIPRSLFLETPVVSPHSISLSPLLRPIPHRHDTEYLDKHMSVRRCAQATLAVQADGTRLVNNSVVRDPSAYIRDLSS